MRHTTKILLFAILAMVLFSCKPTEKIITVEKVKTEYVKQIDSVLVKDSVIQYIEKKGDTIYNVKEKVVVKKIVTKDTISRVDTIPIVKTVTITKEINKLKNWQIYLMLFGVAGIVYIILKIVWRIKR